MVVLVIEDGSGKDDANSYATTTQIVNYAAARGVTIPEGSPSDIAAITTLAIKAMDYLESLTYAGERSTATQALSWPRKYATVDGYTIPPDEIPARLINAQCQAALYLFEGIELLPSAVAGGGGFKTREKLGPMETEYSEAVALATGTGPRIPALDALLAPLTYGGRFGLRLVRV